MRDAETVLGIIRERGRRGLPLERVYRLLFNRDLFLRAYGRIARNRGALTPGATDETVDGMSLAKIDGIIDDLRHERYRWTPVRRVYIAKQRSTQQRPLGLPTWSDKLVQEAIRLILDAYYEPQFSDRSHGFRPGRGCHTALKEVQRRWNGTTWFVEGDISACFDRLDHEVLVAILAERIHDGRFLGLVKGLLAAGYLEDWRFHATLSGSPQGGVVSPLLANLYLDRLDTFVETTLLPAYTRGAKRAANPEYAHLLNTARYRSGAEALALRKRAQHLPSQLPRDPAYRRLRYVRYADDFLLGFIGPRSEAEEIKRQLTEFLGGTLNLELSAAKTLVSHARSTPARFLGYEVQVLQDNASRTRTGRRNLNGVIGLRAPLDVVRKKSAAYLRDGKPIHRAERLHESAYTIVRGFQAEYRGVVEYYRLAYNRHRFRDLKWVMEQALTKTLAAKQRTSVAKVYRRYGTTLQTPDGPRQGLAVRVERDGKPPLVAHWGGISLKRQVHAVLDDRPPALWNTDRTELEQRLLADTCELCGATRQVEVHHARALKNLRKPGRRPKPRWVRVMAARQRKTLVVCRACHEDIHAGRPPRRATPEVRDWRAGCGEKPHARFGGGPTEKCRC